MVKSAAAITIRSVATLAGLPAADWNALVGADNPFLRHEFLTELENHDCVGPDTHWLPVHLLAESADGRLLGAMPLYEKTDSWGEFVFDFAWAQAYARAGLEYYPKLVAAVPFTPVTGARLLLAAGADHPGLAQALLTAAIELTRERKASSVHVLFPTESQVAWCVDAGYLPRIDCRFLWRNQDYANFDAYLADFKSAKRKKAKRERRRIREAGIRYRCMRGDELDAQEWHTVNLLIASTFMMRGHRPYLNEEFWTAIAAAMGESVVVQLAIRDDEILAAAVCFRDSQRLYGRYWGSRADFDSLHFETCYYRGIDYCIDEGLQAFDPGTQGEHKLSRGFAPSTTWSAHWIADAQFARAIDSYLAQERRQMSGYLAVAAEHLPFRAAMDDAER